MKGFILGVIVGAVCTLITLEVGWARVGVELDRAHAHVRGAVEASR